MRFGEEAAEFEVLGEKRGGVFGEGGRGGGLGGFGVGLGFGGWIWWAGGLCGRLVLDVFFLPFFIF